MKFTASILAIAGSASAHMNMVFPVPYGHPNNSPLAASGADFPCKATGSESYTVTAANQWNAGETQNVTFRGSVVHGGGSCQFSLTTDLAPTKDTQWKVIHSAIGGCPSTASNGNLSPADEMNTKQLSQYPITLPADLPAGEYTFAWTWFNKVGNREMYMNCAPITVGGGSGGAGEASTKEVSSVLGSLPDMFVANVASGTCETKEGVDFQFPDPGKSVNTATSGPGFSVNIGSGFNVEAGCASVTRMGAGAGSMGSPSQATGAPSAPAASQPAATSAAPSAVPSNPGGIFAPGASSAAPQQPVASTSAVTPQQPATPTGTSPAPEQPIAPTGVAPAPVPVPSQPAGNVTPPTSGDCTPCSTDGAVVCIGSNQFGMCNFGCAVPQALAAGTVCADGKISAISRRSVRFPRAHLHRRHGSQMI